MTCTTTREFIEPATGFAILMGGGPASVYGADALVAFDRFGAKST